MSDQCISIVLPVYNEADNIRPCLERLWDALQDHEHEILVCYDFDEDTTLAAIASMESRPPTLRLIKNNFGPGVAYAIQAGFRAARGDVVVTTMADLSDPPEVIVRMAEKVRQEGAAVVSGSRYMSGGSQTGGPYIKQMLSRLAGLSLHWVASLPTHDATTNFRAYSRDFLSQVRIESRHGFEVGLELTVKAHLQGLRVSEVPSSWTDRSAGESRFRLWHWLPHYLYWYWTAMAAPLFVWGVWIFMVLAAFAFVTHYGSNTPYRDDWENVAHVTGHLPITLKWLWSQHNEHRIPLPRLLYVGVVWITGGDFRSVMFLNVATLSVVAFAFILAMRRLLGRTEWSDAFFPLALLHWGQADTFLRGFQIAFASTMAVFYAAFLLIVLRPIREVKSVSSVLLMLCILTLPLCSGTGLILAPSLLLWLGLVGISILRTQRQGIRSWSPIFFLVATVAGGLLIGGYMVGYTRSSLPPAPGLRAALLTTVRFLSLGIGPVGKLAGPFSAYFIVTGLFMTILVLGWQWVRTPPERLRIAGIFAGLGAMFSVALAIGYSRAGLGADVGYSGRFVVLSTAFPCLMYTAWALYAPVLFHRVGRWGLCVVMGLVLLVNTQQGLTFARSLHHKMIQFQQDVALGRTPAELAVRHPFLFPDTQRIIARIAMLQEVKYGPFRSSAEQRHEVSHGSAPHSYPMFDTAPDTIQAVHVAPQEIEGKPVLLVHAPGRMRFRITTGTYLLTGSFGLVPGAYMQGKTDGVVFRVTLGMPTGETRVLFARTLAPLHVKSDQGMQSLAVTFQTDHATEVALETQPGSANNSQWDWSYWTQIRLARQGEKAH